MALMFANIHNLSPTPYLNILSKHMSILLIMLDNVINSIMTHVTDSCVVNSNTLYMYLFTGKNNHPPYSV